MAGYARAGRARLGDIVVDNVRYILGVVLMIMVPLGILYWFAIHLFAPRWRELGPVRTYCAIVPVLVALGMGIFHVRRNLMGADLGTNWILAAVAVVFCLPMTWLEMQYWRQLNFSTLLGVPELSRQPAGKVLREGIYARVRHPRYLSAGVGVLAEVLIVNYMGVYILAALMIIPGRLLVRLEERELIGRFGKEYRRYQEEVPGFFPWFRKTKAEKSNSTQV